ncbi:MAG: hypothetical protein HYX60_01500 [Legionella longbeachae]|nr:hypothetical protein [Legionella longbeachae]
MRTKEEFTEEEEFTETVSAESSEESTEQQNFSKKRNLFFLYEFNYPYPSEMPSIKSIDHDRKVIVSNHIDSNIRKRPYEVFFNIANEPSIALDLYRFVIDGYKQKTNCVTNWEEREKGSLKAVLNGFMYVIKAIQNETFKPTIDCLKKLHAIATTDVNFSYKVVSGDFRKDNKKYGIVVDETPEANNTGFNASIKGMAEILSASGYKSSEEEIMNPNFVDPVLSDCVFRDKRFLFGLKNVGNLGGDDFYQLICERVQMILEQYQEAIKTAETEDEKLNAIVSCVRRLEIVHPFDDANSRTICVLFLNALLMSNGFIPVILDNPNKFDGYAQHELLNMLKNGMQNTKALLYGRELFMNGFSSEFRRTLQGLPGSYSLEDQQLLKIILVDILHELKVTEFPQKDFLPYDHTNLTEDPNVFNRNPNFFSTPKELNKLSSITKMNLML